MLESITVFKTCNLLPQWCGPKQNPPTCVAQLPHVLLVWHSSAVSLSVREEDAGDSGNRVQLRAVDHDCLSHISEETHSWPCQLQQPGLAHGGQEQRDPGTF